MYIHDKKERINAMASSYVNCEIATPPKQKNISNELEKRKN
jgi:hypothetical protein